MEGVEGRGGRQRRPAWWPDWIPDACPDGHELYPGHIKYGWMPCPCPLSGDHQPLGHHYWHCVAVGCDHEGYPPGHIDGYIRG